MNSSVVCRQRRSALAYLGFAALAFSVSLTGAAPAWGATIIRDDFGHGDYPSGSTTPGWASGWTQTGTSGQIRTADPLNGPGDPYLSADGSGANNRTVRRQFNMINELATIPTYKVSWQFRYDGDIDLFTGNGEYNNRIHFFADSTTQQGSGAANSWLIGVVAGDNNPGAGFGSIGDMAGNFYFYDRVSGNGFNVTNLHDTGVALEAGVVYEFEVTVYSDTRTYDATVSNGLVSYTAEGLRFRNATAGTTNVLHFGANAAASNNDMRIAIDSLQITGVPEPSSLALAGLAGVAGLWTLRRRCAGSRCAAC